MVSKGRGNAIQVDPRFAEAHYQPNDAGHAAGYTNGHDWLCSECYTKFWDRPDFFSSSYSDIT